MSPSYQEARKHFALTLLPWGGLIGLVLLLCLIVGFLSYQKNLEREAMKKAAAENRVDPPINVEVQTLRPEPLVDRIQFPGVIRPWEALILPAEVNARVLKIHHDKGDEVKAGTVIATLDDRDYRATVDQAEAAWVQAQQNFTRIERLRKKGAVSQADLDRATSTFKQAKAAADTARHNLERCRIKAPFDGFINQRFITQGAQVSVGSRIIELLDIAKVRIDVGIPERDVNPLRACKTAEITIQALEGKRFTAKRIFLSAQPMEQGLIYLLQLSLPNDNRELRPGMFVDAHLVRRTAPHALIVPLASILPRNDRYFCFVAKGKQAERRELTLGSLLDRRVEIQGGLQSGDALILKGHHQLEDGQSIHVVKADGAIMDAPASTPEADDADQ
ncbi:MAG: efflux RND transporter periplasmic adaptor subunit [Planctomycetota bacterium]|jgi:RND family efflux transporter MFP subunit